MARKGCPCGPKSVKIVMCRHGESEWNQQNLFCGWYNANLSAKGMEEAKAAGKGLRNANMQFDVAFTSVLKRANLTLENILKEIGQPNIPVVKTWRLNERHYGALTGMNKTETAEKYGEEQVKIWRRSFDNPPPPMDEAHPYYNDIVNDPIYANGPPKDQFPMFESLKLTIERTLPFWNDEIVPQLRKNKRVIIAAHGNSLRGIIKHIEHMGDDDIMNLNLPTGIPFVYTLDQKMDAIGTMEFLGDPETVARAIAEVAAQGKKK